MHLSSVLMVAGLSLSPYNDIPVFPAHHTPLTKNAMFHLWEVNPRKHWSKPLFWKYEKQDFFNYELLRRFINKQMPRIGRVAHRFSAKLWVVHLEACNNKQLNTFHVLLRIPCFVNAQETRVFHSIAAFF